jgi:hypothetical protein
MKLAFFDAQMLVRPFLSLVSFNGQNICQFCNLYCFNVMRTLKNMQGLDGNAYNIIVGILSLHSNIH